MTEDRDGFEWKGRFYRWSVSDLGKDLMLIDRIAQMPASEFLDMMGEIGENERAPILLGLIATSIRAGHPDWSVDRIYRVVMGLSLSSDIEFISSSGPDEEEEVVAGPPAVAAGPPTSGPGGSPSNGSSPPSTPAESSTSPTSSVTQP